MNKFLLLNSYRNKLSKLEVSPREAFVFGEWVRLFLQELDALPEEPGKFNRHVDSFLLTQKREFSCTPREIRECARALRLLQQMQ